jgi:hypothetical protein
VSHPWFALNYRTGGFREGKEKQHLFQRKQTQNRYSKNYYMHAKAMQKKMRFFPEKCKIEVCILLGINCLQSNTLEKNTCIVDNCRLHPIVPKKTHFSPGPELLRKNAKKINFIYNFATRSIQAR